MANTSHNDHSCAALLRQACTRNVQLELHIRSESITKYSARARMIRMDEQNLYLDKPHVIGRRVNLTPGQKLECYFNLDDTWYTFFSTVKQLGCLVELNQHTTVQGLALSMPDKITQGQRRECFRTSLATVGPVSVFLHQVSSNFAHPSTPINAHCFEGILVDASDCGLGIKIENTIYTMFKIFDRYFIHFAIPDSDMEFTLLCELRQTHPIIDGSAAKLGFMPLPWPDKRQVQRDFQSLQHYLTQIQRSNKNSAA